MWCAVYNVQCTVYRIQMASARRCRTFLIPYVPPSHLLFPFFFVVPLCLLLRRCSSSSLFFLPIMVISGCLPVPVLAVAVSIFELFYKSLSSESLPLVSLLLSYELFLILSISVDSYFDLIVSKTFLTDYSSFNGTDGICFFSLLLITPSIFFP